MSSDSKERKDAPAGEKPAEGEDKPTSKWSYLLLILPVAMVAWLALNPRTDPRADERIDVVADEGTVSKSPLEPSDMPSLAAAVAAVWEGDPLPGDVPARLKEKSQGVYVVVRSGGERRYHGWGFEGSAGDSLAEVLSAARDKKKGTGSAIDSVEVFLAHSYRELDYKKDQRKLFSEIHRGVRGLEIKIGDRVKRFSPTWMLASNRKFEKQTELIREELKMSEEELAKARFRTMEGEQVIVHLDGQPRAQLMERGNTYVPASAVTKAGTKELTDLQAKWLVDSVHEDGRMTYMYWPSRGRESGPGRNNMIRQWMATVALGRLAEARDDQAIWDLEERNIDYNLGQWYREENGLGMIEFRQKVKLGALALACYAIVNHPKREKWSRQEEAMRKTIHELWHDDGSFSTFYKKPSTTKEQHNFYPGEALFFWAELYEMEKDPALLEKFMKSFEYYRGWHLDPKNRNPAFIPWHTEAYYQVWRHTENEELRDFIFEMNDWLLLMQQWDDIVYRDTKGRFYSTGKWYGPPHASATGVYMEGLIDAWELAKTLGDAERQERYRVGLARGMRSIMQLQFVDEVDMFYVSKRDAVVGGLRTTVYDNQVRCDNVQHSMMANLKVLDVFTEDDYRIEE